MENTYKLSIDSEIFAQVRADFDKALSVTVENMRNKDCDHSEITLKLKIDFVELGELKGGVRHCVTKPEFEHQISTAMSFKEKLYGSFRDDCELVCDTESGEYAVKLRGGTQLSVFDSTVETELGRVEGK